jgi:hypothetical protein
MKHLHIISFDIPFPADYGGVIDVFYKIKALHELGVDITLHCFEYGERQPQKELENYCKNVFYYKRTRSILDLLSSQPFIVKSRENKELLANLLLDKHPILFEGLHTCFYLNHPLLENRYKMVRCHNIEHEYYYSLFENTNNLLKQFYFKSESKKLKKYESVLSAANKLLCISENDTVHFIKINNHSEYIPAFHGNELVNSNLEFDNYILYHANLCVSENEQMAIYLIQHIFTNKNYNYKIAGKEPSSALQKLLENKTNIELIANPTNDVLNNLISKAKINIVTSMIDAGFKLKLINALYLGGHCIVNKSKDEVLKKTIHEVDIENNVDFNNQIDELMLLSYSNQDKEVRNNYLNNHFSNHNSAKMILLA